MTVHVFVVVCIELTFFFNLTVYKLSAASIIIVQKLLSYRRNMPRHLCRYSKEAKELMFRGLNPDRGKRFFSFPKLWNTSTLLFNGHCVSFQAVKPPERYAEHTTPSRAKVKNEWSFTLNPPICFHGVYMDNF